MVAIDPVGVFHDQNSLGIELCAWMQVMVHVMMTLPICKAIQLLLIYLSVNFPELLTETSGGPVQIVIIIDL